MSLLSILEKCYLSIFILFLIFSTQAETFWKKNFLESTKIHSLGGKKCKCTFKKQLRAVSVETVPWKKRIKLFVLKGYSKYGKIMFVSLSIEI